METVNPVEIEINKPLCFTNVMKETAGDTYKYWNKLLKSKTFENVENIEQIVSSGEPRPAFEEKLKLILIDNLQLKNEVVNVLLSQNDYFIKRVLRFKWFFQNLSSEFCIKEVFPKVSVSVRYKIINKLSKYLENEEEAEKLLDFVGPHYGYEGAEVLLPKCSSEFILNYCKKIRPLMECDIQKRQRILLKICQRYPETGLHVLALSFDYKIKTRSFKFYGAYVILRYLAGNHTDLFIPFYKKYFKELNCYGRIFSRKLSWKLVRELKDFFFESKLIYSENLNRKYVFSKFDTNCKIKFLANLVHLNEYNKAFNSWEDSKLELVGLMKCVPPKDRYSIITTVFKEVYDLNFQDQSKFWSPDLLELLPINDRQYFAENLESYYQSSEEEFKECLNEKNFERQKPETAIYLYGFHIAFDKFKSIISKTPDKFRRQNIMLYMVKCSQINNDAEGLEKVVDFVATRHRHEDPPILFAFADNVCTLFPKLTSNICRKLENLLLFSFAKGSFDSYSFNRLLERDIYLCLESKKDQETNELIKKFFEFAILKSGLSGPFLSNCKNKHSKTLLLAIGGEINQWIQSHPNDSKSDMLHYAWINTCEKFNRINKSNKVFVGDVHGYADVLKKFLKTKYNNLGVGDWFLDTLDICEVDCLKPNFISKHICRLLKRNPKLIVQHLENVLSNLNYWFYSTFVKQSSFLNVSDRIKELSLHKFQKEKLRDALNMYSRVCTVEEFEVAIQEFIPQDDHVKEGADYNFSETQLFVPTIIKHIKPSWKNLNLILRFYRGDFLKQVISSFYVCCYNSRVDFIVPFLKEFILTIPQRVSYKKGIIRLICALSNTDEKIVFCLRTWKDEKHYSNRKILLQFLTKTFLEHPTRELFSSLVNCILDSEEVMFNDEKPDFTKVPKEFTSEYAMALWQLSKSFNVKKYFQKWIIGNFNLENIKILSAEFCEEVLKDYLFSPKPIVSVEDFACFYCAAGPGTLDTRLNVIFNLMREFKIDAQRAASFFEMLRNVSHENPAQFVNVFSFLLKNWPESQSLYEEKLLCHYYHLYYGILQTSKERNIVSVEFGKQLRELYSKTKNLEELTVIVADTLKQFMNAITRTKLPFHPILVVRELIGELQEKIFAIIAFGALSPEICGLDQKNDAFKNGGGDRTTLSEIYKSLESKNDDVLWIYFRRNFKKNKPVMQA